MSAGHDGLADRLIDALGAFDLDAIAPDLAPGFRRWLNLTGQEQTAEELLATFAVERTVVAASSIEVRHRVGTDDGFVLELTVSGTTAGGRSFRVPVCLVVTTEGDKVARIHEYANIDHARPILDEMLGQGRAPA